LVLILGNPRSVVANRGFLEEFYDRSFTGILAARIFIIGISIVPILLSEFRGNCMEVF
jgi:hypothetical protein